jgi:hypothetical protein
MEWELESEEGNFNLTAFEIINELMRAMMQNPKPAHEMLSETFVKYLQMNEKLHQTPPQHLALMSFTLGYYYHVFLKSNKVKVLEESNEDNVSEASSQPGGSVSFDDGAG